MRSSRLLLSGLVVGALMIGGLGCKRKSLSRNTDFVGPEGGLSPLGAPSDMGIGGQPLDARGTGAPLTGELRTSSGDRYYCDNSGRIIGMETARWGNWGVDLTGRPLGGETPNVLFAFDSAAIQAPERPKIEAVAALTEDENYRTVGLVLEGHCDDRGTEEYNLSLGERRSLAVREQLLGLDVASERITTVSFGEAYPVDPGQNEEAWRKNRRVVFVVTQ